jgi:hypothetical protein
MILQPIQNNWVSPKAKRQPENILKQEDPKPSRTDLCHCPDVSPLPNLDYRRKTEAL